MLQIVAQVKRKIQKKSIFSIFFQLLLFRISYRLEIYRFRHNIILYEIYSPIFMLRHSWRSPSFSAGEQYGSKADS